MHLFSLPSRTLADQLLDQYWSGVHLFYPWIHAKSFLRAYERLWLGNHAEENRGLPRVGLGGKDCSQTVFYCALNAILALGCEFSECTYDDREHLTTGFMDRVHELLQIDLLDNGDLAIVQTLLLVAIYLQSTQHPLRCWGVASLAYRMALGIGLHLNYSDSKYTVLEVEMRRRAWHGCMLMDR